MFTGIIEHMGRIAASEPTPAGRRLLIDPQGWSHRPGVGESISISGCCLTLAAPVQSPANFLAFDVVPETLSKTRLGTLKIGDAVNLEHAATASTLLGGHVVQGHVDAVGEVRSNGQSTSGASASPEWRLRIRLPAELLEFMTPKGSIAIDGVSLTLAAIDLRDSAVEIALIPTTLAKTTLGSLKAGSPVNVEADVMAKTVVNWLKNYLQR